MWRAITPAMEQEHLRLVKENNRIVRDHKKDMENPNLDAETKAELEREHKRWMKKWNEYVAYFENNKKQDEHNMKYWPYYLALLILIAVVSVLSIMLLDWIIG